MPQREAVLPRKHLQPRKRTGRIQSLLKFLVTSALTSVAMNMQEIMNRSHWLQSKAVHPQRTVMNSPTVRAILTVSKQSGRAAVMVPRPALSRLRLTHMYPMKEEFLQIPANTTRMRKTQTTARILRKRKVQTTVQILMMRHIRNIWKGAAVSITDLWFTGQ